VTAPRDTLSHREPALVLDTIEELGPDTLRCRGGAGRRLHWAQILDGCAQTAGLLARARLASREPVAFVVATYEHVTLGEGACEGAAVEAHDGASLEWIARFVRRIGDFHQIDVTATDAAGRTLLGTRVALAQRRM
jgi:hypothetical protein